MAHRSHLGRVRPRLRAVAPHAGDAESVGAFRERRPKSATGRGRAGRAKPGWSDGSGQADGAQHRRGTPSSPAASMAARSMLTSSRWRSVHASHGPGGMPRGRPRRRRRRRGRPAGRARRRRRRPGRCPGTIVRGQLDRGRRGRRPTRRGRRRRRWAWCRSVHIAPAKSTSALGHDAAPGSRPSARRSAPRRRPVVSQAATSTVCEIGSGRELVVELVGPVGEEPAVAVDVRRLVEQRARLRPAVAGRHPEHRRAADVLDVAARQHGPAHRHARAARWRRAAARPATGVSRVSTTVTPSSSTITPALARPCPLGCWRQANTPGASSSSSAGRGAAVTHIHGVRSWADARRWTSTSSTSSSPTPSRASAPTASSTSTTRRLRARQPVESLMLRPGGTVSGPTQMALADAAAYALILAHLGPVELAVTSSLNIVVPAQAAAGRRDRRGRVPEARSQAGGGRRAAATPTARRAHLAGHRHLRHPVRRRRRVRPG